VNFAGNTSPNQLHLNRCHPGSAISVSALPIMVTLVVSIWLASISQNKRLDDIVRRLERMEGKLDIHEERLVRVEERTSPLRR